MVLRELITVLGFDVDFAPLDQFDEKIVETKEGITDLGAAADESLDQIKSALKTARNFMIGFSVATAAGAVSLFAMSKSAANVGDEISKTAPMLGLSTEEYQKYRYAAELAGVENESFVQSTQMLLNHIGELKAGNLATAISFRKVGLSVGALRGMSTAQVYRRISEGLEKIPDQATRIQVSMDLLGRSGARLGTFLAKGTANLDSMMSDVEAFGMFTKANAEAANDFNDSLDRVRFFLSGIKNEIGMGLFPVFRGMLDDIREWLSLHRDVIKTRIDQFIRIAAAAFNKFWTSVKSAVHGLETLIHALGGINNALWLLAISIAAPMLLLLGPLFLVFKAVTFLLLPFLRLHTLLAVITFAVGSMIPLWHLLLGVVGALVATRVYSWLIQLAGGYRVLAMRMFLATAELVAQAAALAIIILAFEDLTQWILGNKSLIGEWLGTWKSVPRHFAQIWEEIKAVFRSGGKFIAAVFKGDFKEAYRLLNETADLAASSTIGRAVKSVATAVTPAGKSGAAGNPALSPYGFLMSAPVYSFAGSPKPAPGRGPGLGSFLHSYTMVSGKDGEPVLKPDSARAARPVSMKNDVKIDVRLELPAGTPADHAEKTIQIVDDRLRQHIDHSLQQSVPPGG